MKYVDMQEVAFDPQTVAFPGLGNCHGIVYVNDVGMFAYHLSGVAASNRIKAFANFVSAHPNGGGKGRGLYGLCPTNRYTLGDKEHKAELKLFAKALHYDGKIHGHRWNVEQLHWHTTYVEVHFNDGPLMFSIEGFDDTKQKARNGSPSDHKSVWLNAGALPNPVPKDEVTVLVVRTGRPVFFHPSVL